jgi:NitT/TauT family transport system ATP-binding protein
MKHKPDKLNIPPQLNPEMYEHFQKIDRERREEKCRPEPVLRSVHVKKSFGDNLVIPDLDFTIEDIEDKSEIISVIGPSGCGKSTILNLIAGLIQPTSGELFLQGEPIEGPGKDRGMIFQKYSSFPFLTVLDNVAYPLIHVRNMKKSDAHDKAKYWIDRMSLTGAEYKFPHQLSGGMQQRVAIARTLGMDARIILMDEPFGALDRKIRWEMQDLMAEILFQKPVQEVTVLLVTHDIPEAIYLGDRMWVLNKGDINEIEYLERPEEPARVAQGKRHFLEQVTWFNEKIDALEIT